MLIGIDASRANRGHKSGTEWYSYYIIRWLAKLDDKNEYILYSDKPICGGLLDLSTRTHFSYYKDREIEYDKDGFQILRSPHNNFKAKILNWPFSNFWTLGRLSLEMIFNKPDILYIPAHTLPLIFPKNTINTIHDIAFERDRKIYDEGELFTKKEFSKKILNVFVRLFTLGKYKASSLDYLSWSTKFSLKHSKSIITVSNFTKNEILDVYKYKYPERISVIYNGYSRSWYRKIDDKKKIYQALEKYGIEAPYVLYVGRLEKKKNTPNLIESFAMAIHKNKKIKHKLVLIGDASYGYDEVQYVINEFGVADRVVMPGWVVEEDMPYIYNGADAFVFPSKHEGFGIPVVQAMACDVPLAISNIPVLKEVAGEAAVYFDPEDKNSISQVIDSIISDDKLRSDLITKGRKRVQEFSWEKTSQKTLELFASLGKHKK